MEEISGYAEWARKTRQRLLNEMDDLFGEAKYLTRAGASPVAAYEPGAGEVADSLAIYREAASGKVNVASCGVDRAGTMALVAGIGFGNTAEYVFVLPPTRRTSGPLTALPRASTDQGFGDFDRGRHDPIATFVAATTSIVKEPAARHLPVSVSAARRVQEIATADSRGVTAAFVGYGSPEGVATCVLDAISEPLGNPPTLILPYDTHPDRGRALRAALIEQGVEPERIHLASSNKLVRTLAAAASASRRSPATELRDIWLAANLVRRRPQAL